MKKVLLTSILIFLLTLSVFAYETVIIKFPQRDNWVKSYYKKVGTEAILQYLPANEHENDWTQAVFVHSYNYKEYPTNQTISVDLARMTKLNPTGKYKYYRVTPNDSIAGRCTEDYKNIKAQCEIYRVSNAHGGQVTIHYINRDKDDFQKHSREWYDVIRKAKFYNSYYRTDRTLDKSEYGEL